MNELPKNWTQATLGELCEIARGGSPRPIKDYLTSADDGISWVKISDATASSKYIFETKEKIKPKGLSKTRMVQPGDFLLSNSMSFGRPYIMKTTGCIHDGWLVLRDRTGILDQDFLYQFLGSPIAYRQFDQLAAGSTVRNLNSDLVRSVQVLIPPPGEQKRIAAKLDRLRAHSSRAIKQLQYIPKLVERYKSAMLAKIFSEVPKAKFRQLGHIAPFVTSGSRGWAKHYSESGSIFVRVGNIQRGAIDLDLSDTQFVSPPKTAEGIRTKLQADDIVITITADLGRVGVIPPAIGDAYINQHVSLVRLAKPHQSKVIAWYLSSAAGQRDLLAMNRGVTRSGLGLDDIRGVFVPDLGKTEAANLEKRIDASISWLEQIAAEYVRAVKLIPALDKAILARAFRGELVLQNPNDEPAFELLGRTNSERVTNRRTRRDRVRKV